MDIELVEGKKRSTVSAQAASALQAGVPAWFARFVNPRATEVRHVIQVAGMPRTELIVRPEAFSSAREGGSWRAT
ncbi:MAG: hypothetical protein ACREYC_27440 [Gammaproteobacteria bacterium]